MENLLWMDLLIGKSLINGPFSIAMLDCRRVAVLKGSSGNDTSDQAVRKQTVEPARCRARNVEGESYNSTKTNRLSHESHERMRSLRLFDQRNNRELTNKSCMPNPPFFFHGVVPQKDRAITMSTKVPLQCARIAGSHPTPGALPKRTFGGGSYLGSYGTDGATLCADKSTDLQPFIRGMESLNSCDSYLQP